MAAGRAASCRLVGGAAALVLAVLSVAGPGRAAAGPADTDPPAVDYSRDEPPAGRSWMRPDGGPPARGPLEGAAAGEPGAGAPEAAVRREEGVLVRALVRMVLVLAGLILGMLVLARGARALQARVPRWVGGAGPASVGPRMKVVERLSLGPRHTLAWVERDDGGAFLVAFGEGGTSLLGPLGPGPRPSFAATMAEVSHEPTSPPSPAPDAATPAV